MNKKQDYIEKIEAELNNLGFYGSELKDKFSQIHNKQLLNIHVVGNFYLVKFTDASVYEIGLFIAKSTKLAHKKAKKQMGMHGDCESSFTLLNK